MRIVHLVCTAHFAGVERHIAVLAAAQYDRGHEVTVLGGDVPQMRAAIGRPGVRVIPVLSVFHAVRLLTGPLALSVDVVATHMTAADLAAASAPALYGTAVVSTRHFAAQRGSTPHTRAAVTAASGRITAEIAVSRYIADATGHDTSVVLPGIPHRPAGPPAAERTRTVLVVQRLETEKDTDIAVRAFAASGLVEQGWRLAIAGDGAERSSLEELARDLGVHAATDFLGHRTDVEEMMTRAGLLVAPCPSEGLGMSVLEAMASGLPVVASGAGGHLESVGPTPGASLFPPRDAAAAAAQVASLARDPQRRDRYGSDLRERQQSVFSIATQATATDEVYQHALAAIRPRPNHPAERNMVVISLEPWDRIWRRNQHLIAGLLQSDPGLRVLFVEPATDPLHTVRGGALPRTGRGLRRGPHLPGIDPDGLWLLEPTKLLPRRIDGRQDARWAGTVHRAARKLAMPTSVLWVNDPHGAEVMTLTGWPTLYDITDDWLEAHRDQITLSRLERYERLLMDHAVEVVVCSPGLERSKAHHRSLTLLRNAVDPATTRATPRPADLPAGATAVYVGTLHSDRLDIDLCVATATATADRGRLVLVGPDALAPDERDRLTAAGATLLGDKDHRDVPGYLQHADVLLVPHVVDDFTESLDPIKLYEYRAVGRPVVSTPVSGFREAADHRLVVVDPADFASTVRQALPAIDRFPTGASTDVPTWAGRVAEMRGVIDRVRSRDGAPAPTYPVPLDVRLRFGHAAVQQIADEHLFDILHIKGHSLDERLIQPNRSTSDVDVLVRPEHVEGLVRACTDNGYHVIGRFATSSPFEHATTLWHTAWGYLDVHRLYPGIGLSPGDAFAELWRTRGSRTIATVDCPCPDVAAQIVILVLHAARDISGGRSAQDVEHVWHAVDPRSRDAVMERVEDLLAHVAFTIGIGELERVPPSAERELWTAVTRNSRLDEWRARIAAAPGLEARVRLIARLPLVNTDHIAMQLGRRPTPVEIASAFVDRAVRAVAEYRSRGL
ncbi:glycosyltransferase [Janibacter sp. GS2]|uniref:glycosyltransferase n=1 Tax=Janibacter sp. GS2 TaxID=3442646 RepID=UPI003EB8253F